MHKVALNGLKFKAYHGYYDEEKERGNDFVVDIAIIADFKAAAENDDLEKAVDYEELYSIVKKEMQISSSLLEHVVYRIANKVLDKIKEVETVEVSLAKLNPPIKGSCKEARVTIQINRN